MTRHQPTREAYQELLQAFDFYNNALFGGKLPRCLITMQRERNTYGYFSPDRWAKLNGKKVANDGIVDEIALNPSHFATRSVEESLSTLVHEMVHLQQHHFGKPGRGRYHNKEWATMMDVVGLCPSDTGKEGGNRTGDHMSHYIVDFGPFDLATQKLLDGGFSLSWLDRVFTTPKTGGRSGGEVGIVGGGLTEPPAAKKTRDKYSCPSCGLNAWAKPGISLTCTKCQKDLKVV